MARKYTTYFQRLKGLKKQQMLPKENFRLGANSPKKEKFCGIQKIHLLTSKHCFSLERRSNIFKRNRFTVSSQKKCEKKTHKRERKTPLKLLI